MVSALVHGARGPGSSPGRGHGVLSLAKTFISHPFLTLSSPRSIYNYLSKNLGRLEWYSDLSAFCALVSFTMA